MPPRRRNPETEPPRFKPGDIVVVKPTISSRLAGLTGIVIEVELSTNAVSLDKYELMFRDQATTEIVWDIQLQPTTDCRSTG